MQAQDYSTRKILRNNMQYYGSSFTALTKYCPIILCRTKIMQHICSLSHNHTPTHKGIILNFFLLEAPTVDTFTYYDFMNPLTRPSCFCLKKKKKMIFISPKIILLKKGESINRVSIEHAKHSVWYVGTIKYNQKRYGTDQLKCTSIKKC